MKYIKPLFELKEYSLTEKIEFFILYKDKLLFFDETVDTEELDKTLKIDIDVDNIHMYIDDIRGELPHVIAGFIENTIAVIKMSTYDIPPNNKDLVKLKKQLDKKGIYSIYQEYIDENTYDVERFMLLPGSGDLKDARFFHGTCFTHLKSILRHGIKPNTNSINFNIKHTDKVFVTTSMIKSAFHSFTCSGKNDHSLPIILELEIPDFDKLIIDYDVADTYFGKGSDVSLKYGYSELMHHKKREHKIGTEDAQKMEVSEKLGVFGYLGRIPTHFIKTIHYDIKALEVFIFYQEGFGGGEEIEYNSNPSEWSEASPKEFLDIYHNKYDEIMNDFDED